MERRKFGREFKLEAVNLVRERGVSYALAARDLDINDNMLWRWGKEFGSDPKQAFPGLGQMKPEQLEIDRRRRHHQEASRARSQHLAQLVALGFLHPAAKIGRGHAMGLIADDLIPVACRFQFGFQLVGSRCQFLRGAEAGTDCPRRACRDG